MKLLKINEVKEALADVQSQDLIRLIYISDVHTTDNSVFEHIQRHSTTYNRDNHVTGFLCNDSKLFMQYLEGKKNAVLELMSRIFKDINHIHVRVIFTKKVSGYSFIDWRMHSLNLNESDWKDKSEHHAMKEFVPFKPDTWQPWFVESFITAMKRFDNSDIYYNSNLVTFDSVGFKELESRLSYDGLFFWLFLATLTSTSFILLLFKYDVINS